VVQRFGADHHEIAGDVRREQAEEADEAAGIDEGRDEAEDAGLRGLLPPVRGRRAQRFFCFSRDSVSGVRLRYAASSFFGMRNKLIGLLTTLALLLLSWPLVSWIVAKARGR
jgi:hypothetical protein